MLHERDLFLAEVRDRLLQAQEHARRFYGAHHCNLEFSVDDWVWFRLLNRQAQSLVSRPIGKLAPRHAGSFRVKERVGDVAYRLELPKGARIHDVFHLGILKPYRGPPSMVPPALPALENGRLLPTPQKVLKAHLQRGVWHALVQWSGVQPEEAS
jgi:hypothetical protein